MMYRTKIYLYASVEQMEEEVDSGIYDTLDGFRKPETALLAGIKYLSTIERAHIEGRPIAKINVFTVNENEEEWCILSNVLDGTDILTETGA